jgi:hypothetical protein
MKRKDKTLYLVVPFVPKKGDICILKTMSGFETAIKLSKRSDYVKVWGCFSLTGK